VVATAGNDHRLGANEAPPAIISVYLGSQLEDVFNQIREGEPKGSSSGGVMQLGVDTLPEFQKDPGDRNRTSPFAFTGNRFEFRAVGSGQSVAGPLVAMNTILADSLAWMSDQLEQLIQGGASLQDASFQVLKQIMQQHGAVVFGGDGYSEEWHRLAVQERGLENLPTCAEALPVLERPEVASLFERHGVLSRVELQSRYEVYAEQYILAIEVEAKLALRMGRTQIYPAVNGALGDLTASLMDQKSLGLTVDSSLAERIASLNQQLSAHCNSLEKAIANPPHGSLAHMKHCSEVLLPLMLELRESADSLELLVDDERWPLPTYQEMLFIR
jgi:glutamine synthetase